MRKLCCSLPAIGLLLGLSQDAEASEITRVASSFEEGNKFDLHFGVAYDFSYRRAAILREWNPGDSSLNETRLVRDMVYRQQRHTLNTQMEIGLWHDLAVTIGLPIVLSDTRGYEFDQRPDDCIFGDQASFPTVNCVDKDNSTTVRDSIIPYNGFDATSTSNPFGEFTNLDTHRIFVGPQRKGLDQLHLGLKYGILNQEKYSHMPNWLIAFDARIAVGRAATFSRDIQIQDPDGNHRVGRRIHEIGFWTALSRRYRYLDPFISAYARWSIRASGSEFQDFSEFGAQDKVRPQSHAGVSFGTELVPWERKAKRQKVAISVKGNADLHHSGRGYSEIWELLADSPALVGDFNPSDGNDCTGADIRDAIDFSETDPGDSGYLMGACEKFTGITDIQDYATFGFDGGLVFHMGPYARLAFGAVFQTDTRHFLTNADRGDPGSDDIVNGGTAEVNPVRRDVVDDVGRRYVIDDVFDVSGYLRFLLTF